MLKRRQPTQREIDRVELTVTVSQRLTILRADHPSTSAFARHLGITHSVVEAWLAATSLPSVSNLDHVAQRCAVTPCWLMGWVDEWRRECR